MDFPTKYTKHDMHKIIPSEPGSPLLEKYVLDKSGDVVPSGTFDNIQDRINSYKDSCDINLLMQRFTRGESDILSQVSGFYGDVTNVPTNYAELYQKLVEGKSFFESLDPDFREYFNNNPIEFFESFGSDEFNKKVSKFQDTFKPIEQTEIKKSDAQPEV